MRKLLALLFCLLVAPVFGANNFSSDDNCIMLYSLESGALGTDGCGSNNLTLDNTPVADGVVYKEGSYSGDFEEAEDDQLYIANASLTNDFPFKTGSSVTQFSITVWFMVESHTTSFIVSKYESPNYHSFAIRNTTDAVDVNIGYSSGANSEIIDSGVTISTGVWYHLGYTLDFTTGAWKLRLWNDTSQSVVSNLTGTLASYPPSTNDRIFDVGGCATLTSPTNTNSFDGRIDEVVVFKDILTVDEIDQIRSGLYPKDGAAPVNFLLMDVYAER